MPDVKNFRRRWFSAAAVVAGLAFTGACARVHSSDASGSVAPENTANRTAAVAFDATRAYSLLQRQCDFGPRNFDAEGHQQCLDFMTEQLRPVVDDFATQTFTQRVERGPGAGRSYAMTNVLGLVEGTSQPRGAAPALMLCAHWDTRPVADQDADAANHHKPIMGANDGASGVATLLEVARVLKANRPARSVVIALWDGEDLGEFFYGARYFARTSQTAAWRKWRPQQAVLIDMIGDSDLRCNRETTSVNKAPDLYQAVMDAAAQTGHAEHFDGRAISISDDHVPLNAAGIPSIDLIDFDYPYWHTVQDTADKCSPDSLKIMGDVLLHLCAATGRA